MESGCGYGNDAIFLAKQGFDVTAVEIAKLAIEKAKERAKNSGVVCTFLVEHASNLQSPPIERFIYLAPPGWESLMDVKVYFENLHDDEKYAWLSMIVGFILVIIAIILW